jgi:hypothetical protein
VNPSEQFRRHAAECREMARATRDKDSRLEWNRLAERWMRCAELAAQAAPPPSRRSESKHRPTTSNAHAS